MGKLIQLALRHAPMGVLSEIKWFCARPVETQAELLRGLLSRAENTEWGRRFDFGDLSRERDVIAAFQARVPLQTYEDFRQDIVRIMQGEADICWPGNFHYIATSAGTTSRGKPLPLTTGAIRNELKFGRAMVMSYLSETGRTNWIRGARLAFSGSVVEMPEYPGMLIGDTTACVADYRLSTSGIARSMARSVILPEEIRNLSDFRDRSTAIADLYMHQDVRMIVMAPSWGLMLMDRIIERYNEQHKSNISTLAEIWPNLQLFITGGLPLRSYRESLDQRLGKPDVDILENYGASEGPFAFQTDRDDPSMLLHLNSGVFFEFVRMDELKQQSPRRYTVADVEVDVPYSVVLSNCNGLWAYRLNDVVRFTRLSPHKLEVGGRANEVIDTYGEYLLGEEARAAILHASRQTNSQVREFHITPRPPDAARHNTHQWLIEFDKAPGTVESFARALDARLCEINASYNRVRTTRDFDLPEVTPVPRGLFAEWLQTERASRYGQPKVPIMSEGRDLADWLAERIQPEFKGSAIQDSSR